MFCVPYLSTISKYYRHNGQTPSLVTLELLWGSFVLASIRANGHEQIIARECLRKFSRNFLSACCELCRRYVLDSVGTALRETLLIWREEGALLPWHWMAAPAWHNEGTAAHSLLPTCPVGVSLHHVTCATSHIFCPPYQSCDLSSISILPNIVSDDVWCGLSAPHSVILRRRCVLCCIPWLSYFVQLYIYDLHWILHYLFAGNE